MNQKEFELIGRVFNEHRTRYGGRTDSVVNELIEDMTQALENEYPKFNKDLFIESTKTATERPDELASALALANGAFAPAVLTKDYGANYFAWVFTDFANSYTEAQAIKAAQHVIDAKTKGYLNDNWNAYTNAPGMLEWFKTQEFVINV